MVKRITERRAEDRIMRLAPVIVSLLSILWMFGVTHGTHKRDIADNTRRLDANDKRWVDHAMQQEEQLSRIFGAIQEVKVAVANIEGRLARRASANASGDTFDDRNDRFVGPYFRELVP